MIVLDTNVTSELVRTVPTPAVVDWLGGQPVDELFTTAITVAEIRYGIARLPQGERRNLLGSAADEVFWTFADQILAFDAAAAASYAGIVSHRDRAGTPISVRRPDRSDMPDPWREAGHPQCQGLPGHRDRHHRPVAKARVALTSLRGGGCGSGPG